MFYLPSIGSRSETEQGMAGLRDDLYQRMLDELREQAQLADDLGYTGSIETKRPARDASWRQARTTKVNPRFAD